MSIGRRLILYLMAGFLPVLIVSVAFLQQSYRAHVREVLLRDMATARATAGAMSAFVTGVNESHRVAGATIIRQGTGEIDTYLREVPVMGETGFALPDGRVVAGFGRGTSILDQGYFQAVRTGSEWSVSPLDVVGENFIIASRVESLGRLAGVLFTAIPQRELEQFVALRIGGGPGYGIIDSSGRSVVSTTLPAHLVARHISRLGVPGVRRALAGEAAFAEPFRDPATGVLRMGAVVPVPGTGWVVTSFEPVYTALAPARRSAVGNILSLLIVLGVLVVVIRLVGRWLTRPIVRLSSQADAVARGDFSRQVEPPDRAELGMLASAFNNMTAELAVATEEQQRLQKRATFLAEVGELLTSTLDLDALYQLIA
ncbi:MAG: HAMP domain-containing protein, partial [Armatimonadota bacterium]